MVKKKNIIKFLKPDWRKILLTFIILVFVTLFTITYSISAVNIKSSTYTQSKIAWFLNHNFVLFIVVWYVISCLIMWVYDKSKEIKD